MISASIDCAPPPDGPRTLAALLREWIAARAPCESADESEEVTESADESEEVTRMIELSGMVGGYVVPP